MALPTTRTFFAAAAVIILVQATVGLAIWWFIPMPEHRGQFGDMFGAVNALFSGFAFAGVIYSLILHRHGASEATRANERSARLSAMTALVAAYSERLKYLQSGPKVDENKVSGIQRSIKDLIIALSEELVRSDPSLASRPGFKDVKGLE